MQDRKTAFIIIRVTKAEKDRLETLIEKQGHKNMSELVRDKLGLNA